jgi:Rrf2 family protein
MSHRGAKGGFSLVNDPSEISLLDIIEAVEGPIAIAPCLDNRQGCDRVEQCEIYYTLDQAQSKMVSVLKNTSLADLATNHDGRGD